MFVDACAIVSLITAEPTAAAYDTALGQANAPCTSVMAAWEAIIVLSHPAKLNLSYTRTETVVVAFLEARNIETAPIVMHYTLQVPHGRIRVEVPS